MTTRTLVVTVGAAAVLAAGLGGYAAVRRNHADRPAATEANPSLPSPPMAEITPVPETPAPAVDRRPVGPGQSTSAATVPAPTTSPAPETSPALPVAPPLAPVTSPPAAVAPPVVETTPPPVVETPRPPDPPRFEELVVKEDSVIGIRLESAISSETAKVEDRVLARVTRDVTVDGRTAIPSGARLEGTVTLVETGGKFKDRARLGVRFTTLILSDNVRIPLQTETIFRSGEAPAQDAGSKIGASAVVGAILGAVVGGKKGAAVGTAVGAAGGTAAVAAGARKEAIIEAGAPLTVRLTAPVKVIVEKT